MDAYKITNHARQRWRERFDDTSMDAALLRSVPYGVQLGSSEYRMDVQTGAVFVILRGVIKTVLTKEMAIANQQASIRSTRRCDFQKPIVLDSVAEQVKALATRHVVSAGM